MTCEFRFIDYNYAAQNNVDLIASSENVNFPVSNLKNEFRSKVWRTDGTFVIETDVNDKIDFREVNAGPELTAVIPAGSYSYSELAAEIKAQMEAVSVDTFTVVFSILTGKWTISTSGSHLSLIFATGSSSAETIAGSLGFDGLSDYTGALTYTAGAIAIHTEESLVIDLKTSEQIDSFCIFFDPRAGIEFSDQAIVKLQANATNIWDAPDLDITLEIDNQRKTISHFFSTAQSYRYWRIILIDPKNVNLYVELGTVVIGKATILNRVVSSGFRYRKRDNSRRQVNDFGNPYFDKLPKIQSIEFNFGNMEISDIEILEEIYDRVGITVPFVVALDPLETIYNKDQFLIYGHFTRQFDAEHVFTKYFNIGQRVEESF